MVWYEGMEYSEGATIPTVCPVCDPAAFEPGKPLVNEQLCMSHMPKVDGSEDALVTQNYLANTESGEYGDAQRYADLIHRNAKGRPKRSKKWQGIPPAPPIQPAIDPMDWSE